MGRHLAERVTGADEGRRTVKAIAAVGALAIAAVLGAGWMLANSADSAKRSANSLSPRFPQVAPTLDQGGLATAVPSDTFLVPTPSFATPTLAVPLGSVEPEIPGEAPGGTPTSVITPKPTPSPTTPKTPPGTVTVRDISLQCELKGRRVRATLTFTSTGLVPVSLTAGDRTQTGFAGGKARLDVLGLATGDQSTCRAVVNGQSVGPIKAK